MRIRPGAFLSYGIDFRFLISQNAMPFYLKSFQDQVLFSKRISIKFPMQSQNEKIVNVQLKYEEVEHSDGAHNFRLCGNCILNGIKSYIGYHA